MKELGEEDGTVFYTKVDQICTGNRDDLHDV